MIETLRHSRPSDSSHKTAPFARSSLLLKFKTLLGRSFTSRARSVTPSDKAEQRRLMGLASVAIHRRRFAEAISLLSTAGEHAPHTCVSWNLLGIAHECQRNWKAARRFYGKAVAADRRFLPVQQNLRRLYELYTFGHSNEPIAYGMTMEPIHSHELFLTKETPITTPF